ncbi:MAG: TM0106 family RecB-like putative nuclease [Chloroflexi bacterium]|nr:TM0106 family RecB-like putative nuclease [Chloroflexota bacterium]
MDIEPALVQLTKESGVPAIKAGWVDRYVDSPVSFWCDIHAPNGSADPMEPFVQYLFDTGNQHETEVISGLYPGAVRESFPTEEEGFRRTVELMYSGANLIKNMPLLARPIGLEGRPDILEKVDGVPSKLGSHSYRVVEIKSAKNIRTSHILQAAAYNRALGQVQGHQPDDFDIVNRDWNVQTFNMSEVDAKLDEAMAGIRVIIAGVELEPCYGAAKWPWASFVNNLAIQRNDVSLLPGIGQTRRGVMTAAGFETVADVAEAALSELTDIKGIGGKTAANIVSSAQAIISGHPVSRGPYPEVPLGRTEVFFDLEGTDTRHTTDGLEVTNYLIGALMRAEGGTAQFLPFFAETNLDEKANLMAFLEWAYSLDDPVFYHWHTYEKTHVAKMSEFYGIESKLSDWVTGRMVDLSPLVTNAFAFPCYGQGLKDIAKSLGFSWRQDDVDAVGSVVLYLTYVGSGGTDQTARRKILDYNEDDCLATMHIFDWLIAQK